MTHGEPHDDHVDIDDSSSEQQHVRSLLAGLPEPGPMPDDLVARIQARLADEALAAQAPVADVVDLESRRRRMRVMGGLAGVSAVAASAAVVGVLLSGGGLGSLDKSSGHAVAGFGNGRTTSVTSPSAAPSSAMSTGTAAAATVHIVLSDTPVSAASLDAEASRLLNAVPTTPLPGTAESPTVGPLATPKGLTDCLTSLEAPAWSKIGAALTRYEGAPAVVLGLQTTSGEQQAWVLDRTCTKVVPRHTIS